ncbi:hypothetical protein [Cupriavidus nantongensis]
MKGYIAIGAMFVAFMVVIVLGARLNYRWMQRIAENKEPHED